MRAGALFLVVCAVLAAGSIVALPRLRFDHNTRSLLREDPRADAGEEVLARDFGAEDILLLAWRVPVLDVEEFRRIRAVADALAEIEGLEETYALGSPMVQVRPEGEWVMRAVRPGDFATPEARAQVRAALAGAPFRGILYNTSFDVVGVASSFRPAPADAKRETLAEVRRVAREHAAPGRPIRVAGVTALAADAAAHAVEDLRRIGLLAFAVSVVVLFVLCRSVRETLLAVAATGLPPLFALGFAATFGVPVTALGAALFPVLAVVGITCSVHLLHAYGAERAGGEPAVTAARRAAGRLAPPIVLSLTTTAIAFLSLRATGVPAFHAAGRVVAVGMLFAIPVVLVGLPSGLALLDPPVRARHAPRLDAVLLASARWILRRRVWIAVVAVALCAAGVALARTATLEVSVLQAFRPESRIARTYRFLDENLTATVPVDALLHARPDATESEVLRDLERFAERVTAEPGVHSALSLATFVRYGQRISPVPLTDPLALAVLRSPRFGPVAGRFEDRDTRRYRVKVRVYEGSSPELLDRLAAAAADFRTGEGELTGLYVRAVGTTRSLVRDLARGALLMTGLVLLTVALALRSLRLGLAALVPNLLPVALVFGGAALLDVPLDVSAVAVAGVAIGLAIDDTLHVAFRLARERRAGATLEDALYTTQRSVGRALVLSTVVLVAGLGCLVFSAFVPTARFGVFTALACALALPADLVVLPALVRLFRAL